MRCLLWYGLGELGLQHASAIELDGVLANYVYAIAWIVHDLLVVAVAYAIQAAGELAAAVCECLVDLYVKLGETQALGCLGQDHRLQGVAPAHGLVANVGAL